MSIHTDLSSRVREWTKGAGWTSLSMSSGYYAGRPPSQGDINTQTLEGLYKGLQRDVGETAAVNFVRFVNNLDDMSASSFVVAFQQFWDSSCENVNVQQRPTDRTELGGPDHIRDRQAFAVVASAFANPRHSDEDIRRRSHAVKAGFILAHTGEIPEDEQRAFGDVVYVY